jgi:hypothetical protein
MHELAENYVSVITSLHTYSSEHLHFFVFAFQRFFPKGVVRIDRLAACASPRQMLSPGTSPTSVFLRLANNNKIIQHPRSARPVYFVDDLREPSFGIHQETLSPKDSPSSDPGSSAQADNVRSMTGSDKSRARKMSRSSEEREMSTDVKPHPKDGSLDPELDSRGIKRKYTNDALDYPRRRATIAVRSRFLNIAAVAQVAQHMRHSQARISC